MPDREKVVKGLPCLTGVPIYCETCPYSDEYGFGWGNRKCAKECASDALAMLKESPEIVRCKDCKNRYGVHCYNKKSDRINFGIYVKDDWFCADGERKDS